jgi:hypothetical protein
VDVHQPDDVAAAGLERERIDLVRFLGTVLVEPAPRRKRISRLRQREAAFDDGAHAIDGVQQIASLDATARRGGQREIAGVVDDALERGTGRKGFGPVVPEA